MYLDELLQKKWKLEKDNSEGKIYVVMKEISSETYLHCLCKKIDMKYYKNFEKAYNIVLLPELKEFYKFYNGCRLFLSSIVIYGLGLDDSRPMEFFLNDHNKHYEITDKNISQQVFDDIVFFGGFGNYNFYYKQSEIENPKIYIAMNGTIEPVKEFNSIKELLEYCVRYLMPEYDEKGYRKHPNKEYWCKNIPVIANSFWGDIDWEIPEDKN